MIERALDASIPRLRAAATPARAVDMTLILGSWVAIAWAVAKLASVEPSSTTTRSQPAKD